MIAKRSPRIAAAALLLLLTLDGCGKPGSTIAPPGSPYPRYYPSPAGTVPPRRDTDSDSVPAADVAGSPQYSKSGSYIDPSVRASQIAAPALEPGANLPFSRQVGDGPLSQGLGPPTQSPLPTLDSLRPDSGSTEP